MKRKVHFRWKTSWMDLRCDGMFRYEMIKGKVKKILQKDTRRKIKQKTEKEIKEYDKKHI